MNALVLAAGRASRMGVPKVLLPAGRGHTLLSRVLFTALASAEGQVTIVLGRDAALCRAEIERSLRNHPQDRARVTPLENPHYKEGLSTSLRCGVQEVLRLKPTSGTAVFLADQPAFSPSQACDLVRAFRARRADTVAVVAAKNGEQRNPVILSAELLPELLGVEGDKGARGVLKEYAGRVEKLELGSGPWFVDADDWTTYAGLMRERGWLEEVDVPEFSGDLSEGMIEAIIAALSRNPAPLLAPDVLLVGSKDVARPIRLSQPAMSALAEEGIRTVILGRNGLPEDYVHLLRRAALWTLQRSPS